MTTNKQSGFTLVELSIVLIIIGLIVGGVLAGQSLIRSARLQNDITKYNQLDASVNSFNLRYNGIPGDLGNATAFFTGGAQPAQVTNGDGSGTIAVGTATDFTGTEIARVYDHLGAAGMVQLGQYDETANTSNVINTGILASRTAGGIILYGNGGQNFVRFGVSSNSGNNALGLALLFTPEQVSFIDSKLDDNSAINGIVTSAAIATVGTAGDAGTDTDDCNLATGAYSVANGTFCGFRIRLSS